MRRVCLRVWAFFRSGRADAELDRELSSHLQLLEDHFLAQGMSAAEARLAARRAFGGQIEQTRLRQRDARAFRWLDESWLDLKLGARLLGKNPALTVIAVVALAVAIGSGAAYFEFMYDLVRPTLPVPEGERIVQIRNRDTTTGALEPQLLHDFGRWREHLRSVDLVGAAAPFQRNLITADGRSEPVNGVHISASAFQLIVTSPLLGRPLLASDERAGAPPVALIGERLWRGRFNSEVTVIGRSLRLGRDAYTVVGIMPASFGFPVNHSLWLPLKVDATIARGAGPRASVFGRLAPGVSVEVAQAEVRAMAAADTATTTSRLVPEVKHFVDALWSEDAEASLQVMIFQAANIFFIALLAVCAANVATLVFARTATREAEITVRTALGASRSRIVAQLFIEALVLSSIAAGVGLSIAAWASGWAQRSFLDGAADGAAAPFWWDTALSNETILYGAVLTVLSAVIVGVVPALKATGIDMQTRLKHATGGATMKFGGVWTGIIVSQIALTVFFLLTIVSLAWNISTTGYRGADLAIAAHEFAAMRIEQDPDATTDLSANYRALARRLGDEPAVVGVTYGSAFPGMKHFVFFLEVDGMPSTRETDDPLWSRSAEVAANYFEALGVTLVAGRGFTDADVEFDRPVAIVDHAFVQHVLGGRQPIGQRVRQPRNSENPAEGRWLDIVGVVDDLARKPSKTAEDAIIYVPARPADVRPLRVAVAVRGDAQSLAPRLSGIAAETDPMLRVYDATTLDRVGDPDAAAYHFFIRALAIVTAVALLLATAGVYALLAFNVARRTREIGIRTAVGADRWQLLSGIFSPTFRHVALGVLLGSVPGTLLVAAGAPEVARGSGTSTAALAAVTVVGFMAVVTTLACVVPARRALRIQPTEALRAE